MELRPRHAVARFAMVVLVCPAIAALPVVAQSAGPPTTASARFVLRSPAVGADGVLPREFSGDGESASPPLEWSGAPAGTQSYALVMHHVDPEGVTKWYWILYDIPASVRSLPRNAKGIGTAGTNGVNRRTEYAPPHSKGPGTKTYVLTVYALSAPARVAVPAVDVTRDVLLAAIADRTLGSAELSVTYTRFPPEAAKPSGGSCR